MNRISNSKLAYLLLRFAFGLGFFMHGAVRFPKLVEWSTNMAGAFDATFLAGWPALAFAYLIPIAEVVAGGLLLLGGKYVRWGCVLGGALMAGIMFGTAVIERWDALVSQLVHLAIFYVLLLNPHTSDPTKQ